MAHKCVVGFGVLVASTASMSFSAFTSFTFLTFSKRSSRAPTLAGWTPGVRTLIEGRVLPCGCLTGTYETWATEHVTIIDARGEDCPVAEHTTDAVL